MNYQNNKDFAEAQYYLKMLDDFCKTGRVIMPELPAQVMPWNTKEDPLKDYLVHLFNLKITIATGEEVQKFMRQVVNSKIKAKVFYDCVGKFVVECVHHIRFQRQRAWTAFHRAEDVLSWTNFKRMDKQVFRQAFLRAAVSRRGRFEERELGTSGERLERLYRKADTWQTEELHRHQTEQFRERTHQDDGSGDPKHQGQGNTREQSRTGLGTDVRRMD